LKDGLAKDLNNSIVTSSIAYGKQVATAIFEYSKSDGGHEVYLEPFQKPYVLPIGDEKWVPTGAPQTPLSPLWGKNRLLINSNSLYGAPPPPISFSSDTNSEFYKQGLAVYTQSKNNTSEQIEIAKYWADDPTNTCTPPGHSINIVTQLLQENNSSLAKAAVAYAMVGIGVNDAFICCWKCKYDYNLLRPISYIKKYIDPTFKSLIGTPSFPAYTSGHATQSGAASRIYARLFTNGNGVYPFTDRSQLQYGFSVRNFNTFNEMAVESANSRFYGGIHYEMDNNKGLQMGKAIGDNINFAIPWPLNIR
jgi:hypothetical protein